MRDTSCTAQLGGQRLTIEWLEDHSHVVREQTCPTVLYYRGQCPIYERRTDHRRRQLQSRICFCQSEHLRTPESSMQAHIEEQHVKGELG